MTVAPNPALILNRREIAGLMGSQDYLAAVEAGFRSYASGGADVPMPMHIAAEFGAFHAKGARLVLDRAYVAVKLNGNFPGNPRRNGLPTIQGLILLCDATDGSVLAAMDSIEITLRRTAAASVLAARFLARHDAHCVAICGCGEQGRAQLAALAQVMVIKRTLVWDLDPEKSREFARDMRRSLLLDVIAVSEVHEATRESDVIVTATTARTPFLMRDMVPAGAFVAAVGADSPEKSELAPELMANATIVVDMLTQAATMGDLHHAIEAGLVTTDDVHAELGDLVIGRKTGRKHSNEITLFDSTGTAIQDAASAAWIYQRAMARNIGSSIMFSAL
ncbi:MAG TPA: ornithine cyclodeaminase family protein [Rhizomicrobium sp.]|jgi:ornithine cyclodeaminase/alanine dehydrogenase-like protein (mu-crystallin family)